MELMSINKNQNYILKGPAQIKLVDGKLSVVGKTVDSPNELSVPKGKSIPILFLENSKVEFNGKKEQFFLHENTIPEEWDKLVNEILEKKLRKIFIVGEMDTGKSFFCTYLANKLISSDKTASILDCDIGQSDIGPPGTFGLGDMKKGFPFMSSAKVTDMFFIGAHSMEMHLTLALTGLAKLSEIALNKSDFLIVDTTGWVQGDGARALKFSKIQILKPDMIILLQRGNELNHLVQNLSTFNIKTLKVSKKATFTPQEERKGLRERLSKGHFVDSVLHEVKFDDFKTSRVFFKTGEEFNVDPEFKDDIVWAEKLSGWEGKLFITKNDLTLEQISKLRNKHRCLIRFFKKGTEKNLMISISNEDFISLGLGKIEEIDFENKVLKFYSPVKELPQNLIIEFGSLKITKEGLEAGFMEAGIL